MGFHEKALNFYSSFVTIFLKKETDFRNTKQKCVSLFDEYPGRTQ